MPVCPKLPICLAAISIGLAAVWGQTPASTQHAARTAYQRGQAALQKGDLASARVDFEEAVRRAPRDAQSQAALGWVLAQQGELDPAVSHLRTALQVRPDFATARLNLAGILGQQGNLAEAESEARMVVKAAPSDGEAHH